MISFPCVVPGISNHIISLLISIHIGSEISQGGNVFAGRDPLVFKEIQNVRHKLVANDPIQFRRNMDRGDPAHTGQAVFITSGKVSENFGGDPDAGGLNGMYQRTGTEQVICKADSFRSPDFFRFCSVMAKNNMSKLAGQGALDNKRRELLIESDNIAELIVLNIDSRYGVLI